jgi:hypothetical protein
MKVNWKLLLLPLYVSHTASGSVVTDTSAEIRYHLNLVYLDEYGKLYTLWPTNLLQLTPLIACQSYPSPWK